jgi:hypothetical protein
MQFSVFCPGDTGSVAVERFSSGASRRWFSQMIRVTEGFWYEEA